MARCISWRLGRVPPLVAMRVSFHFDALRKTKWSEYAVRFIFGGTISVIAAVLAGHFGPAFGGLFLAFPAIFPASATLLEKREIQKKAKRKSPSLCGDGNWPRWTPPGQPWAPSGWQLLHAWSGNFSRGTTQE
jgi:Protein of unknown function (DUF3147)